MRVTDSSVRGVTAHPRRLRRAAAACLLAAVAVVVALGLSELGLRAVGFSRRLAAPSNPTWRWVVYDPIALRRNQAGFTLDPLGIRIGPQGFRDADVIRPKPPGRLRIACLGDSTTFGLWRQKPRELWATTTYPRELANALAGAGYDQVEVVNAGVPGATSGEGLAQYLAYVRPLAPDVVTIRFGSNDHLRMQGQAPPLRRRAEYLLLRWLPAWLFRLEIVRLPFHLYRQWTLRHGLPEDGIHKLSLRQFELNLRRLVEVVRADGAQPIFLDYPYREAARGASPGETFPNLFTEATSPEALRELHASYQAVVERVAAEEQVPIVRTEPALRAAPVPTFPDYDMTHPNAEGARVIGRRLFEALRDRGWLAGGDASSAPS